MAKEKVFDTSLYKKLPESVRENVILEDLAGLVLEAGELSFDERINARRLEITGNNIIDPNTKDPITKHFSYETKFDRKESRQAEIFYNHLIKSPSGTLSVSVSPSGGKANYAEARINVGVLKKDRNIELYAIPSHLSPTSLMYKTMRLSKHSLKSIRIDTPENLREISIPIKVPKDKTPWEFLQEVFPLDSNAWKTIAKEKPWRLKEKAQKDGEGVAKDMSERISFAISEFDYIRAGAWAEREMAQKGWKLNSSACTGAFNSQLLNSLGVKTDAFGNQRLTTEKWDYHTGNCANCGAKNIEVGPCSICKKCEKVL